MRLFEVRAAAGIGIRVAFAMGAAAAARSSVGFEYGERVKSVVIVEL